ncbi:type VII secretion protein EccCa [Tessaracoccus antarcticus]|uniref:Type VII secretion protein EccCa n=1 Tax=Tessaracoccus antarcticus TaxID=2479848 RepID=A0A3M0G8L2_9ACTN|nr:type VII secretion protein EccCa [Tessaracoccus antarcticus]RMB61254.1 type VII secretion protein EccCa [Tessaracoccus antarcticus]
MGVVTFNRPKRVATPPLPRGDLLLESPPEIPPPSASKPFGAVLRMLPMLAGGLAMGLMFMGGGGMGGKGPLGGVIGGLYGVSMMGMMLSQMGRSNDDQAAQLDANRRDYFRYLAQTRRKFTETADEQRARAAFLHPTPDSLWTLVGGARMWERRVDAEDFASVRLSVGSQQSAKRITPPESQPLEDLEPLSTGALRRFMRTHRLIPSVPLAVDLRGFRAIRFVGDEEACRKVAFAMVAQLVTWHAPTDVALMVAAANAHQDRWHWVKWLPHLQHPTETDGVGPVRMFATGAADLSPLAVAAQSADRVPALMVVVADGIDGIDATQFDTPSTKSVTIEVTGQRELPRSLDPGVAVFEVRGDTITLHRRTAKNPHARTPFGRPDAVTGVYAEMLARAMAPFRMPVTAAGATDTDVAEVVFEAPKDYPAMLGVGDPLTLDPRLAWRPRPLRQHLRVPFGTADDGSTVELDIKESAQGGMGPHGICIGATGSGKSEFLRTLVLGLAMTHSTEQLNFILVDFKGGATFLGLDELPHVSAVITNLEGELSLVDRMADAIGGELDRRMEVLRSAGNFKNREDYETARQAGADIPPMPSLLIVVDEFSELLTARPEFIDLFVQIGRVGRSIAVHQLLASQRLEENKLRGLDTFLSYRIALRTFSPAESRAVIGVPDAYELPNPPGNGYLKYDTTGMTRFKAAYVSGPWHGTSSAPEQERDVIVEGIALDPSRWVPPVLEFSLDYVMPVSAPAPDSSAAPPSSRTTAVAARAEVEAPEDDETLLSIAVGRLRGHGWPSHKVWLPPLEEPPTMDLLLGALQEVEGRGLTVAEPGWRGTLRAPVGLIDKPRQQRRDPWWLDFSGSGGNLGVAGGPQSGKSMALRAAIAGLSLTHTPQEVGFYCLDFGGGSLLSMRHLPHMGSVTSRLDVDRVRRTVAEITSLRSARERQFAEHGIDGMSTYRQARRDGSIPADRFPTDVFFVIDGWSTLKTEFESLEPQVQVLANGGLGFGIHVWVAASKWSEVRAGTKDALQNRIELKLGDAFDSEIDRKIQLVIPTGRPGRGITAGNLHTLIGLPRIDGVEDAVDIAAGQRSFIQALNTAWKGPRAADVRLLPEELSLTAGLPAITHDPPERTVPYGVDELELAPVALDPASDPHMVIIGGPQCGKSNLLRTFLHGLTTRYTSKEAKIIIVDYRRSLLGEIESDHLIGYYPSASAATPMLQQAAEAVRARLPGPDVTQQQLRDRSWWTGQEMFVVVDDYELVATSTGNPMAPFADLISQASDIGLHIILARGAGGAGRAMFGDPLITRMKESANPGLIMSGNKDEGALWGDVKATPMPPGRGTLITRTFKGSIQTALYDADTPPVS